jgi:hypothetical protein
LKIEQAGTAEDVGAPFGSSLPQLARDRLVEPGSLGPQGGFL